MDKQANNKHLQIMSHIEKFKKGIEVELPLTSQGYNMALAILDKCLPLQASVIACSKSDKIYVTHSACEMIRNFETLLCTYKKKKLKKHTELRILD